MHIGFPGGPGGKEQDTWVWSLCWDYPLEERMATHSNILAWRVPWTEESGRVIGHESAKSGTWLNRLSISSVQFSHSVVSDLLGPHEPQQARLPCPSETPKTCSNSCPSSWWCHPTISSSVIPFSCLHSFPASGSFPMKQFFASGGQSIGASVSASVLPMNIQDWFPLAWTGWISLPSPGLSRVFSKFKSIKSLVLSFLYSPTLTSIHDHCMLSMRIYKIAE